MTNAAATSRTQVTDLGELLRYWRGARGRSQLDLSVECGISQRHISFVESGRSVPGRRTLMELADALDVPLRERNALLLAAGYAPAYAEDAWHAPAMKGLTSVLSRMLRQHEPYPAVVMDRHWNVVMANEAAFRFGDAVVGHQADEQQGVFGPARDAPQPYEAGHSWVRAHQTERLDGLGKLAIHDVARVLMLPPRL